MTSFTQLSVLVMSCAIMTRLNGQVMMNSTMPPTTYPPMPSRTTVAPAMGAQQVLSQSLPAPGTGTSPSPALASTGTSQALPGPAGSKSNPSAMMAPPPATLPAQMNKQVTAMSPAPLNQTKYPTKDMPQAGKNSGPSQTAAQPQSAAAAVGGNAIVSEIEVERGLNRSAVLPTPTPPIEKVRNPIIPTNNNQTTGTTAAYQPVNKALVMGNQKVNLTVAGANLTAMDQQPMATNATMATNSTKPLSSEVTPPNGEMTIQSLLSENTDVNMSTDLNQLITTEKFNSRIEKNQKDDLLVQQLIDQLQSASKIKLTSHQLSNQTIFLNSLDAEQKNILESKLKSFQLTPTQQKLERNYLASFVSDKTKAAHQAGFDAIKKGLTPEMQKAFDATEGMQSLDLTDEQKYQFEEGSREYLEDPGSRYDSSSSTKFILHKSHLLFILSVIFITVF